MSAPGTTLPPAVDRAALRVCTPHCGLDAETRLGGEMYELEVLREMAGRGIVFDILLARHKRHPDVPNWAVHRLPIGRGLRWPVAALLLPPCIKRVWTATRFDVLRVHSLRYIGPAALSARVALDVRSSASYHLDRSVKALIEAPSCAGLARHRRSESLGPCLHGARVPAKSSGGASASTARSRRVRIPRRSTTAGAPSPLRALYVIVETR